MPFIQINLGSGRTPEQKDKLIRAVSAAAADAVSVPETSVRVWIVEVPSSEVLVGGQTLAERQAAKSAGNQ
jgi:4-oxalocrotonate tautomerase